LFSIGLRKIKLQSLTKLIYEEIGLPVKDKTKTGAPSTKGKTIAKLINNLKSEFSITEEDLK